jgi:serpin B
MAFLKPDLQKTYESVQKFGYDLFRQNMQEKNPILSPLSVYLTLAMAGCGADGTTKAEFIKVLGDNMSSFSADIINIFSVKEEDMNLSIANSAWIDRKFTVNETWTNTIKSLMGADVFLTELPSYETMNNINRWVAMQTNGLIDQMLTEPLEPKERIRLALFNTIYFKGKWENPFKASDTHKEDFYVLDEGKENCLRRRSIQVDMMRNKTAELEYVSNDFAEGVILPYLTNQRMHFGFSDCQNTGKEHCKRLGFFALKPKTRYSVRDVYNKLSKCIIRKMLSNRKWESIDLKLPKFKSTFDVNLVESLTKIGLTECFNENKANLSLMGKDAITGSTLFVSLVRQNAVLKVDEEGTEAAASTELLGCLRAMLRPQKELYFNEPFLYMILDMERELPLFIGILDNPEA